MSERDPSPTQAPDWAQPYPSRRSPVFADNIVATSQPLATQAGLRVLQQGGNAVDAALAAAITLTVVEPCNNGIGSDAFALVWDGRQLHGLNASGRAPAGWCLERFADRKHMPGSGWDSVTVPGAVAAWVALSERFGKLPFARLFESAVTYARDGFAVGPITAPYFSAALGAYTKYPDFAAHFCPGGRAPQAGERLVFSDTATTLEAIAATKGESFYRGALARRMIDCSEAAGGVMTLEDLDAHEVDWVAPLAQNYRGVTLHEIPPNGQGLTALIALGILAHHDVAGLPIDSAPSIHLQAEAIKLAWAETSLHLADPDSMRHDATVFLDPGLLEERARCIDMGSARSPSSAVPSSADTVYLSTADESGMMVSFIQSNYLGFGSGIVVPGTGIHLQNRGYGFGLDPSHPNCVGPRKRPFHTIIPGFVTRDGQAEMSFGVMGGHMQAQGHVQMMVRIHDHGQNPQAASDAPRWHVREDGALLLEPGIAPDAVEALRKLGHTIVLDAPGYMFGGAQLIARLGRGYCGASDHRKEGLAAGY